jgi:hypothetical protein
MPEAESTEKIDEVILSENKEETPDNLDLKLLERYLQEQIDKKSGTHESKENDKSILGMLGRHTKSMIKAIHGVGLDSKIGEGLIALGLFDIAESVGSQTAELVTKNNIAYTIYSSIYESIPHNMITDQVFSMPSGGIDLTQAHLLSPYIPHGPILLAGLGAALYVVNKTWNFNDRFSVLGKAASLKERGTDLIEGRKTLEDKVNAYKKSKMAKTPKTTSDVEPVKETDLYESIEGEDMPADTTEKEAKKIPAKSRIALALAGIKKSLSNNDAYLGVEAEIVPENVPSEIIPEQRVESDFKSPDKTKNPVIIERICDGIYQKLIDYTGGKKAIRDERFAVIKSAVEKQLKPLLEKTEAAGLDLEPTVIKEIEVELLVGIGNRALVSVDLPYANPLARIEEGTKVLRQESEASRILAEKNVAGVPPVANLQATKIRLNLDNEIYIEE